MSEAVRIHSIAAGGDGVGKLGDGRTVFVPRSAPGDLVELTRLRVAKRHARGRIGRILELGPARVEPRCHHYEADDCGGCQLQHLDQAAQLAARRSIVGEALRRLGKLDLPDPDIVPADRPWEYRARLRLSVDGRRRIGLHPVDRPAESFDLDRCHIADPRLMELWSALQPVRSLLPVDTHHLVLRLSREGGRHLVVEVAGGSSWSEGRRLSEALEKRGVECLVWWHPDGGAARVMAGSPDTYPTTVFEQVHPAMGDTVRRHALAQLGEVRGRHVWDLYAGIGEASEALIATGASVESVELDRRAVTLARGRLLKQLGLPAAAEVPVPNGCHQGRVEDLVGRLAPADLVLTNPPRIGMAEQTTAGLLERPARRVVYVSCDPATLARDVARLSPRYAVASVKAFDLFPQTAHVETVVALEAR